MNFQLTAQHVSGIGVNMKANAATALLCIGLIGCAATPYKMSEKAMNLHAQMTEESALKIIGEYLKFEGKGLCYQAYHGGFYKSVGATLQGTPVMDGAKITYRVIGERWAPSGVTGNVLKGTGVLHMQAHAADMALTFNLQDITYINHSPKNHLRSCQIAKVDDGISIGLASMPPLHELVFHVPKNEEDRFMAALKTLSPRARMRTHEQN